MGWKIRNTGFFIVSFFLAEFFCFFEVCLSFCLVAEFFIAVTTMFVNPCIIRIEFECFITILNTELEFS